MTRRQILTVITGSRLHGLESATSDTDYRGVFIQPLVDVLDPFTKNEETHWIEGETKDDTSFELRRFLRDVVSGSPNSVEILFSNRVTLSTDLGIALRTNRLKLLDSTKIFHAYRGYTNNQLAKMELFTPDKRTPKFAVAYIRSLVQGVELLNHGTITNPLRKNFVDNVGFPWELRSFLKEVKETPPERFGSMRETCVMMFTMLQDELSRAYYNNPQKLQPDFDWIRAFVLDAYTRS